MIQIEFPRSQTILWRPRKLGNINLLTILKEVLWIFTCLNESMKLEINTLKVPAKLKTKEIFYGFISSFYLKLRVYLQNDSLL